MNYFNTDIMKVAREILIKIESFGYTAVIVGGCVRDLILGEEPHDVDIATNCPMSLLENNFNTCGDIGKNKDFGIIIIEHKGFRFEVAQFRTENYRIPKIVEKIQ